MFAKQGRDFTFGFYTFRRYGQKVQLIVRSFFVSSRPFCFFILPSYLCGFLSLRLLIPISFFCISFNFFVSSFLLYILSVSSSATSFFTLSAFLSFPPLTSFILICSPFISFLYFSLVLFFLSFLHFSSFLLSPLSFKRPLFPFSFT